ncbi:hypothetical protein [Trichocoleus sp. FACHB-262]|uniref:hypothetical protein n=1 Tax=Trichocoleus sp. FACHB-262 TaxID=2692869 RepID=UPI001681F866|nr:hypothetical protein [Trichocoleus sp. FACHB-262]MBD2123416.1 hypothetical protein [Trichocoleus sp. FACHB-262]
MMPGELATALMSLGVDHLVLLYAVALGIKEAKSLEPIASKHRSTTIKYLHDLQNQKLTQISTKPGTEKKHRPTYLYSVSSEVTLEAIKEAASLRGIDIEQVFQQRHSSKDVTSPPNPFLEERNIDKPSPKKTFATPPNPFIEERNADKQLPPEEKSKVSEQVPKVVTMSANFEQQVRTVLEKLATEVADLKGRLSRLEASQEAEGLAEDILRILRQSDQEKN